MQVHRFILLIGCVVLAVGGCMAPIAPAEEAACRFVPLDQIYADPVAFNGQEICTEGFLWVEFEGMALYFEGQAREDLNGVRVLPPLTYDEALAQGMQTGDRLAVRGDFTVDPYCYGQRTPPSIFGCLIPGLPVWFDNPVFEAVPEGQ